MLKHFFAILFFIGSVTEPFSSAGMDCNRSKTSFSLNDKESGRQIRSYATVYRMPFCYDIDIDIVLPDIKKQNSNSSNFSGIIYFSYISEITDAASPINSDISPPVN